MKMLMQNKLILSLTVLVALSLVPMFDDAFAYKLTDKKIQLVVEFTTNATESRHILDQMYADFDQGVIEQKFYNILKPVSVGTFTPANIVADWSMRINFDTGVHTLTIKPVITEINVANGVPQPTIIDAMVNDGRDQVRTWLQFYGIDTYKWYLYYDGGLQIVEES